MKLALRSEWLPLGLVAAVFVMAAAAWPTTPDRVPLHFGLDGRPDGWGSRAAGLTLFPAVAVFLYLLPLVPLALAGDAVPRAHEPLLRTLRVAILGFVLVMFAVAIAAFHGVIAGIAGFVYPSLAALLLVVALVVRRLKATG